MTSFNLISRIAFALVLLMAGFGCDGVERVYSVI